MKSRHFFSVVMFLCSAGVMLTIFSYTHHVSADATPKNILGSSATTQDVLSVTADDLKKVGFTGVTQAMPTGDRFHTPPYYFHVAQKVTASDSEAADIVMVSMVSSPTLPDATQALYNASADSHSFSIVGGTGKEATLFDQRTEINFIKGTHYVVIIGPDKTKIENLALIVAGKM